MHEITPNEWAAIYYHVAGGCDDWHTIFKIAFGENRYNNLTESSKKTSVSKWKSTERFKKALETVKYDILKKKQEIEAEAFERFKKENAQNAKKEAGSGFVDKVNYLNRDEFLKDLNERANRVTDEKLLNDILKMLSENMRYKEADQIKEMEIQRFYTPLQCKECPLYMRESEIIKESKN